ncbi:MAG TPA: glycosyltransferase 87 family protein [Candidatus Cybelea sp.]|nr:glycosyltransferase 87 family protein [Candidatus Cybelea sp.]
MNGPAGRAAFAVLSLVLAVVAFALAQRGLVGHQSFKAFYCAGAAVRHRMDPYRVEPLRSCERNLEASPMPEGYVEPAPQPGYVLAGFALLSALPARLAAEIFSLALVCASVLSALALGRLIRAPSYAVLLALAPLTLLNVAYGEIPPLALAAICVGAYLLHVGRPAAAGVVVCLALIQPNVGLPAVVAVLIFAPGARLAILLTGAALAGLSAIAIGVGSNAEYFTRVLPLLANAEIVASDQYSLSRLLYVLGTPSDIALLVGKIWFAVAAIGGIFAAGWLTRKRGQSDLLPLLPPAAVTLFGIYLHDIQILIAVPAALVLAARMHKEPARSLASLFVVLLVTVWTQAPRPAVLLIDAAGAFGALLCLLPGAAARRIAYAAAGSLTAIVAVVLLQHFATPAPHDLITHSFSASPDEFSPIAWGRYLRATPELTRTVLAPQLVTWIGLLGVFACALAANFQKPTLDQS